MFTYAAINLTNKKFQVGSTTDFKRRQKEHLEGKGDLEFQRSLRKNPDNFFWLVSVDDELNTRDEEQFYLDFYCGSRWCYNHNPKAAAPPSPKGKTWKWDENKRKAFCGEGNHMYGKPSTEKQKAACLRGKHHNSAKPCVLIHPDGTEEKFDYLGAACEKYNLQHGNLAAVARGTRKQHKGFRARYLT